MWLWTSLHWTRTGIGVKPVSGECGNWTSSLRKPSPATSGRNLLSQKSLMKTISFPLFKNRLENKSQLHYPCKAIHAQIGIKFPAFVKNNSHINLNTFCVKNESNIVDPNMSFFKRIVSFAYYFPSISGGRWSECLWNREWRSLCTDTRWLLQWAAGSWSCWTHCPLVPPNSLE